MKCYGILLITDRIIWKYINAEQNDVYFTKKNNTITDQIQLKGIVAQIIM